MNITGFFSDSLIISLNMTIMIRIGIAASILGVSTKTLRRWNAAGTIKCWRTAGGHRRFSLIDIKAFISGNNTINQQEPGPIDGVAVYCRVSSHEQKAKGDLGRQVKVAINHCNEIGLDKPAVYTDVGSGLNAKRSGLGRLCKAIENGQVARVIVTFKDRLTRFGFDYLQHSFASHGASIDVIHQALSRTMHDELVEDLVAIITSFSGRLHGMRGRLRRQENNGKTRPTWRERDDLALGRAVRRECSRAWNEVIKNSMHPLV